MSERMDALLRTISAPGYGPVIKPAELSEWLFIHYTADPGLFEFLDNFAQICKEEVTTLFGLPFDAYTRAAAIRMFFLRRTEYERNRAIRKGARSPELKS